MKILVSLLVLVMTSSVVLADNFFQNTNPFPTQDMGTPKLNNIYETEPEVIKKEEEVAKKANAKWWDRLRSAEPAKEVQTPEAPAYKMINEGVINDNNSFVVFPAK